jgi:murein DD-endopeptidase MepM/ murein hydrolase activator NlpD
LTAPVGGGNSTGGAVSLGGDWAGVDQWNSSIQSAASATGLDPNMLKAVMKLESNGDPGALGAPGVGGLMQINAGAWGTGAWTTNNDANILKGAQILKQNLDQYGGDMNMALRAYHGFGSDGNTTDTQYADIVMGNYNQLTSGTASASGAGMPVGNGGVGSSQGLTNLFGAGANVQDWGGFNVESSNGLYGYGTAYGLDGTAHTGVDVVVPYGTPYNAAFSGTVVCAGTNNGAGTDGGGCAAFQDLMGGGAGRIEVLSDDGNAILIYGHSSKSDLAAGSHVNAGQALGVSGGENSAHVHVEARVRDASMPSGWRIVDPTPYINGGIAGSGFSASAPQTPMGIWRANHVGGGVATAPAGSDPWSQWRAAHVGA